ncbi:sigma-70 family RNA polymerase sigma factor [Actinomadura darangshiensis]|uniref:sigma-70 family RNA polymerase sigma factor n=1 Tax=Actinomadura darangshiensis TaxID=705336 RepID=UPI001A9CF3A8|nr:sigma-70 family RNA polymerase sigma factor [Actinomadura darangshiensis]
MGTDVDLLVRAAQDGDAEARERLVAEHLPLLYNVVGWALGGHADVDDVVQDSVLRALRGLDGLREPARFRSWLISIAMNQVRRRWSSQRGRTPMDPQAMADVAGAEDDFAELAVLRLDLSDQRREIAEATRWLDPGERELLALWWLEASGHLTRKELADGLGLSGPHAAVRVQRMKKQLATCRAVARVAAGRRCDALGTVLDDWDGRPSPLWRKRIAKHLRGCRTCTDRQRDLAPPEALLAGLVLVPFPAEHAPHLALTGAKAAAAGAGRGLPGAWAAAAVGVVAAAVVFWGLRDSPPPDAAPPVRDPVVSVQRTPSPVPSRPERASSKDEAARPAAPSTEQQVVRLVNTERSKAGCRPLRVSSALHTAAQRHSADMAARRALDHRGAGGDDPGDRITAAGFRWSVWAENIARGQATPSAVVGSWMDSAGHRANILNCRVTMVGVAVVRGAGGPWWTQVFAAPR